MQQLVSIICLGLNHSRYIEKTMYYLINQSYKNIEIIFIDANSADDTFELGKKILTNSNISHQCIKNNPRLNISQNLNLGIKMSKGEYISIASCDDWMDIKCIEEKLNFYLQHPYLGLVYSDGYFYYDKENEFKEIKSPITGIKNIYEELLKENFLHNKAFMVHKSVFEKVGLFNESVMIEDWEMSLRIAKTYSIGHLRKHHFYYRIHSSNMSINPFPNYFIDCFKILKMHKTNPNHYKGVDWLMNGFIKSIKSVKMSKFKQVYFVIKYSGWRTVTYLYLKKLY